MKIIYFDNISTTRPFPEVVEAMLPYLGEYYGNPASLHQVGQTAKQAIEGARIQVAELIGAKPREVCFTSSGTEANNLALKGATLALRKKGRHIITSSIEHYSVLHPCRTLSKQGFEVTYLPTDKYGMIDPEDVRKAITKETILISIMHANNEVGTIQPIAEVSKVAKEHGVLLHTDAVQSAGKLPISVTELGVDILSLAGSQFYGPKGSGALYVRRGVRVLPLLEGGTQEGGRRPGTHNVAAIVGMGKAAQLTKDKLGELTGHLLPLQRQLQQEIPRQVKHVLLTGHPERRIPGHVSLCVEYIEGESMLLFLDMEGIAAASGSACTSEALKSSYVLDAMGIPAATAQGSLVLSLGEENTAADVERFLEVFPPIVERLRKMSPFKPNN